MRPSTFICICLFSLTILGCGGGDSSDVDRLDTAPVKGTLKLDGQPFGPATVELMGADTSAKTKIASGQADDSGSFTLGTYDKADGVVPGKYKVLVTVDITSDKKLPAYKEIIVTIDSAGNDALELNLESTKGIADPLLNPNL